MKPGKLAPDFSRLVEDVLAPEDVHEAARVSSVTAANGLFVMMALILTTVHAFLLYLFLGTTIWPTIPVLLHLVVSAVVALIAYTNYRRGMDVHYLALLAIVSTLTGIFGTAGALLGFFASGIFRARSQQFSEWYETIFPTDTASESQTIYDSIVEGLDEHPSNYNVMPFMDVMRLGSEQQKRVALSKMTSRFHARFSPAFRLALNDHTNAIRVQAATAIAKIERQFTATLERIELARIKEPSNALLTLALAKFYDDYAFTGILDTEVEKTNRERAVASYKSYLERDPNSVETWQAVGRLLFRAGRMSEAADWFRSALDRGMHTPSMLTWYFECLFRLNQHRDLRRAILEYGRGIVNEEDLPTDVREAVSMWMQVA